MLFTNILLLILFFGVLYATVEWVRDRWLLAKGICRHHSWYGGSSGEFFIIHDELSLSGEILDTEHSVRRFRLERRCLWCSCREYYNSDNMKWIVVPGHDGKGTRRH